MLEDNFYLFKNLWQVIYLLLFFWGFSVAQEALHLHISISNELSIMVY